MDTVLSSCYHLSSLSPLTLKQTPFIPNGLLVQCDLGPPKGTEEEEREGGRREERDGDRGHRGEEARGGTKRAGK